MEMLVVKDGVQQCLILFFICITWKYSIEIIPGYVKGDFNAKTHFTLDLIPQII